MLIHFTLSNDVGRSYGFHMADADGHRVEVWQTAAGA